LRTVNGVDVFAPFLNIFLKGERNVIVECPVCRTRYRTESTGLIAGNTFFECTREDCHHVFPYIPSFLQEETAPDGSAWSLQSDSDAIADEPALPWHDPQTSSPPTRTKKTRGSPASEEHLMSDPLEDFEDFPAAEAPFVREDAEENSEVDIAPWRQQSRKNETNISLRPLLGFLGTLVMGYAALMLYCLSHLEKTEAILAQLPVLGPLFAERASAQQIALLDLHGSFWLTKDGRRVFAISGRAVNDAAVAARNIQIEGVLYDTAGKVIGQQVIFCGTETAPAVLERLTVREIGILQSLVPPKQLNIPAGQSVNFLIVFTSLPSAPAQFSCRVVAAQFG
jgi:hypothetical protein